MEEKTGKNNKQTRNPSIPIKPVPLETVQAYYALSFFTKTRNFKSKLA